eukprot:Tamp_39284.p1 GENE.Tamp_39284~~Tamp_39284.p1  ORF type:complete len:119 (+),score=3.84 Tamp_39284:75-431(+)
MVFFFVYLKTKFKIYTHIHIHTHTHGLFMELFFLVSMVLFFDRWSFVFDIDGFFLMFFIHIDGHFLLKQNTFLSLFFCALTKKNCFSLIFAPRCGAASCGTMVLFFFPAKKPARKPTN